MKEAIGIIETVGLVAAISAADTALKAADITLIGYENSRGSGLISVKISGKIGAVKAAIDAVEDEAKKTKGINGKLVIPRPQEDIELLIYNKDTVGYLLKDNSEKDKILAINSSEKILNLDSKLELQKDQVEVIMEKPIELKERNNTKKSKKK